MLSAPVRLSIGPVTDRRGPFGQVKSISWGSSHGVDALTPTAGSTCAAVAADEGSDGRDTQSYAPRSPSISPVR
ncbi:hypothetical protein GCM10010278_63460 [Streptomyces melanogenes]|nr:hypothetical protein GCM10010278_63460 [Streptomyces melanogenes]